MPKDPYPYEVNDKLVTGNGSLIPICSLANRSLLPSLTVPYFLKVCPIFVDHIGQFTKYSNFLDDRWFFFNKFSQFCTRKLETPWPNCYQTKDFTWFHDFGEKVSDWNMKYNHVEAWLLKTLLTSNHLLTWLNIFTIWTVLGPYRHQQEKWLN